MKQRIFLKTEKNLSTVLALSFVNQFLLNKKENSSINYQILNS